MADPRELVRRGAGSDSTFGAGRLAWLGQLGNVRNVVRQEMISRQLDRHLRTPSARVLDVGAGQGTQSIRLARAGHRVLAVEPDPGMRGVFLAALGAEPAEVQHRVTLREGSIGSLATVTGGEVHEAVLLLGVLMYLQASEPTIAELAAHVVPGGFLALAARTTTSALWRPAARQDWQAREHRGARIVNEPGALNFNGLSTRDAGRAQSFYGAVFGWGTLSLPSGQMWTLPGYGDYLERLTPGIRAMTAQFGVPGFEDVVAAIIPIAGDDPATPAHWNVTFGTDDADAAAERAAGLGGEVLVPPSDGPFVRMTVLRDPQGATFTASKFVPENKDLA